MPLNDTIALTEISDATAQMQVSNPVLTVNDI
jgi:hypothetical protein